MGVQSDQHHKPCTGQSRRSRRRSSRRRRRVGLVEVKGVQWRVEVVGKGRGWSPMHIRSAKV